MVVVEVFGRASTTSRATGSAWASPHNKRRTTTGIATGCTAADDPLHAFEGTASRDKRNLSHPRALGRG